MALNKESRSYCPPPRRTLNVRYHGRMTSPGQKFNCDQLLTGRMGVYTKAGPWGQPQYERFIEPGITSCTSDKATLSATLNAGEKARVELNINVSATDPGPWTDIASITSQDKSWEVSTRGGATRIRRQRRI